MDPDHLPGAVKDALWALLPRSMTGDQKTHFLYRVGESVQEAEMLKSEVPAADQIAQLRLVNERAHALLLALGLLSGDTRVTLRAHADYLAIGTDPPARLAPEAAEIVLGPRRSLMGHWWDAVQDVETATAYAATQVKPAKTARPKQMNARRLAFLAARDYYAVAGRLPPASKGAWFPPFAGELGQSVGYSIGPALAASVVREMQQSGQFAPKDKGSTMPDRIHAFFKVPGRPPD